jgi:Leucine-rich repeat (LRR) protein
MANKLRVILEEIGVLTAEMNAFRFKFKPQPPMPVKWRQTDACIPTDFVDIISKSRVQEKKDLVDRLLARANNKDIMVLPIVGMGGLGKTTLAQLVYNDPEIQKHFELRLWVCVSYDFDVDSLANRIMIENGCEASQSSSALDNIRKAVSGKRYLLVLDDVWNRDEPGKWERLKSYLQHGGSGSSVLTTTRDEAVAKLMMGTALGAYKLGSLDEESIEKIVKARAFSSTQEKEWSGELVNMVGEVAKRCAGSPLAATALGSLLGTKTSKQEWDAVLHTSTICDEENGILPVLKLSYNCLPSYMRQCFAFCAMFPKDYEIDVQMLIHLWMANGFIPEQSKVCPETFGERIFIELKSRSFFQDLKNVPFEKKNYISGEGNKYRYCSRIICKIHDLMHDVAQSAMGEECAAIATHPSEREDVLRSVRHLYLSIRQPETLLDASLEKGSPTFLTLICDRYAEDMKILSQYNSIRALKISRGSFLRPKYLRHLRYLDLSRSDIKALPEDISILYHLQTLNLSHCHYLERLPKELKYLTALRHLYTHGCPSLNSMPAELRHLTSLQTLTYFVASTESGCCNLRELQHLDLGGKLELSKLQNVEGADAQAAGLRNKKKLTELELCWIYQEAHNNIHNEVLEGLKPHDELKALRINYYGSSTFPAWMNTLRGMVELVLFRCKKLEKLPACWQLPALQILRLQELESLNCLCSGGNTTPVTFPKLKVLILFRMAKFESWWETHEVQGEELIFPEVEELEIKECQSLTALPIAASVITKFSGRVDTKCRSAFPVLRKMTLGELTIFERWEAGEGILCKEVMFPQLEELSISSCGSLSALPHGSLLVKQSIGGAKPVCCRSAFPALRKLELSSLSALQRWGAGEGISGEEVTFPQLEELSISDCGSLSALPKGSLLVKQSCGGAKSVCCRSAFPTLRKLKLSVLPALQRCGAAEGTPGEEVTFPLLENLTIDGCPRLTDLPEAPKLNELSIFRGRGQQQISLEAASRFIPSLSRLNLDVSPGDTETTLLRVKKKWNDALALPAMWLTSCNLLFSSHSSALALWTCFAQLVNLEIWKCDALDYWPDNVFQVLVCLRYLSIYGCSKLTGRKQASDEQSAPAPERAVILPCLEFLVIEYCESLVEVPDLPASLKTLHIKWCDNLKSIIFSQQQEDTRLVSGEGIVRLDTSSISPGCSSSEATVSTAVRKLSSAANRHFLPFPCLESLLIQSCDGLSVVTNIPPSIKTLEIALCSKLESLESCLGELWSLEELDLSYCRSLASLPDRPQAYSSLRVLKIRSCDGIKLLPRSLQNCFDYLEEKRLDARFEGKLWFLCFFLAKWPGAQLVLPKMQLSI